MVSMGREHERVTVRSATPDVVIGGAPRSGTTFLCELLAKHPQVYVAQPYIPEPKVCMTPHPAGDAGLLSRYASFFAEAPPQSTRVEKTSYYFENAEARERLTRLLPQARFVFILREPVARAYSNWSRTRSQGLEKLPFEEAIELDERSRPVPLPPDRAYARPFDYLIRGQYGNICAGLDRCGGPLARRLLPVRGGHGGAGIFCPQSPALCRRRAASLVANFHRPD